MWTADITVLAIDLTREDLMLDRRQDATIQGEVEEACRVSHTALPVVEQTASDGVAKKLARVYNRTGPYVNVGVVAELRDRMRPLVAATA
ncbi:hypothetical protein [Nocardia amamiensis]|uniref:hypothetical protein n=1 Tax=Nocardia amamiensis TaxID=404578 RepID=UPI00082973E0|nr:hypothetical protein [Nocardia amamiensis]